MPGCGASGVGRSPTPDCLPSGRAAGAHYPPSVGTGGCRRGDPSPTPQRALLRAGFACCGGGTRAPGAGASCLGVGCPGSGALPPPTVRPLGGLPGPTTHRLWVRGGAGMGTHHQPHSARSCVLWGRHEGARGGASCLGVGRPGSGALPPPTACPLGGLPGPTTHWLWVQGGCWRGDPSPTPQRAHLRAGLARCGGGTRAPGGGPTCLGVGCPGSGALPPPTARPLGGLPGPATHWLWVRGGAGVGTCHRPHSARSCVLWGRHEGARGGRLLPGCGASGVGRSPSPDCPPSGWAAGAHYPLAVGTGGCRRGDPSPTPKRALLRAGVAHCGGGMRVPGGGRLLPGCGASGVGRSPTPDCLPSERAAEAHHPLAVGAGGCGRGDPSPTPQRALFRAGFVRCGGSTRAPGGGRLLPGCGASGVWRSPTPDCPPSGRAARAHYPPAVGAGGLRAWGPVTNPTARALASWLCALWGRQEGAREGRLVPGCGASGFRSSPTPDCPPSGWAAGAHYPLADGAGGCGRGDPSPTPQCALLRAVGAACRCPGGALPAWLPGVRGRALSHPRLPALCASCRGPLPTGCGSGGLRAWGPVTNPRARALASWLCALWGQQEGPGGGAPLAWVWGVRGRTLSHPLLPALWAG